MINGLGVEKGELPVIDRFFMAERAFEIVRFEAKLAIVWHPEYITGFMESVAVNRAAHLRIFGSVAEAENWLMSSG